MWSSENPLWNLTLNTRNFPLSNYLDLSRQQPQMNIESKLLVCSLSTTTAVENGLLQIFYLAMIQSTVHAIFQVIQLCIKTQESQLSSKMSQRWTFSGSWERGSKREMPQTLLKQWTCLKNLPTTCLGLGTRSYWAHWRDFYNVSIKPFRNFPIILFTAAKLSG